MSDLVPLTDQLDIAAPTRRYSPEDAANDLKAFDRDGTERPSVRILASRWSWSKSAVDRFLKSIDEGAGGGGAEAPDASSLSQIVMLHNAAAKHARATGAKDHAREIQAAIEPRGRAESSSRPCWIIPHQNRLEVHATADGVEICELSPLGHDDDRTVSVTHDMAVCLARLILYAAGWEKIYIYADGDGRDEIFDGRVPPLPGGPE